jgi:hypothetical protein
MEGVYYVQGPRLEKDIDSLSQRSHILWVSTTRIMLKQAARRNIHSTSIRTSSYRRRPYIVRSFGAVLLSVAKSTRQIVQT